MRFMGNRGNFAFPTDRAQNSNLEQTGNAKLYNCKSLKLAQLREREHSLCERFVSFLVQTITRAKLASEDSLLA